MILIIANLCGHAQIDNANLRANWVFLIPEKVEWSSKTVDLYRVGVYGEDPKELPYLQELAKTKMIKEKPVIIVHCPKLKNIKEIDILFVEEKENENMELIYPKIKGEAILLITYKCANSQFIMINLLLAGIKKQFEVNSANLSQEGITIDDKLMAMGGTKIDLQGLFEKKVAELVIKEKELSEKEILLNEIQNELDIQKNENARQKNENELQKAENERQRTEVLQQKETELTLEKARATELFKELEIQKTVLYRNQLELKLKENELRTKQTEIEEKDSTLMQHRIELDKKIAKIREREIKINEQTSQIETQQFIIWGTIIFVAVLLISAVLILRGYRINKRINNELHKKNNEINKQKEEIELKSFQLSEANVELEKLSIVAAKTQNAIAILDRTGKFEWINHGFTILYGYTYQLLINELDNNIINVSKNDNIADIIHRCVNNKENITYETINTKRNGENIWVQTTLTPIVDSENNVIKIIAIDAEITKLKEQEREIRQKNEELNQQKDELYEQKEQIELKNKLINSSIQYAQTIQNSILPSISKITKDFDAFILFRPKDIVSGDFYWYTKMSQTEFYVAAVDCTGHGVPGAFMSLIGSRILNNLVAERNLKEPKIILEMLNKSIVEALNQEQSTNNDGMDICFCKIIKQENKQFQITFTGAKRPLYYYQKEQNIIDILKADRKSIGGVRKKNELEFTNQTIILNKEDIIYLSTDGFIDQNTTNRRRFGSEKFVELLNNIKQYNMTEQKLKMETEFDHFRKDEDQRDDITVFAIKFI